MARLLVHERPGIFFRFNRDLGVVPRCLGIDNKEANGEFWRSRTACSLESSSNLITCGGDHRVRMIYHSHSSPIRYLVQSGNVALFAVILGQFADCGPSLRTFCGREAGMPVTAL